MYYIYIYVVVILICRAFRKDSVFEQHKIGYNRFMMYIYIYVFF